MLFRQFVDDDLGCASYLIGDPATGEAFVVDPAYAIEQYLEAADDEGVRIVRVLETHTHADAGRASAPSTGNTRTTRNDTVGSNASPLRSLPGNDLQSHLCNGLCR